MAATRWPAPPRWQPSTTWKSTTCPSAPPSWAPGSWPRCAEIQSPLIREVRGLGLMVGIELKQKVTPYLQALMAEGVLALPAGLTVMRFLPPLVIEKDDLVKVVETVKKVLAG